ncbi:MAG: MarR family winged helix-turn-helix transcriptional regulator [Solirubrobacteraceae bacterium]
MTIRESTIPGDTTIARQKAVDPIATDAATRLRVAIGRLSRRLRRTAAGAALGLTPTRISVLLTVVREGPIRLSALAESEGLNPTMLSRVISDLVDAGLVLRTCDDGDRRAAWAEATPAGEELAQRMRRERTDALNAALDALTASHRRQLERALPAIEVLADRLREARP